MEYFFGFQEEQRVEHLFCEASDHFEGEASEGVGFDEFVEVHVEEFGGNAKMTSEVEALREVDHAVLIERILDFISFTLHSIWIWSCGSTHPLAQLLEDVDFNQRLLMKTFLVPNDLDSY